MSWTKKKKCDWCTTLIPPKHEITETIGRGGYNFCSVECQNRYHTYLKQK